MDIECSINSVFKRQKWIKKLQMVSDDRRGVRKLAEVIELSKCALNHSHGNFDARKQILK